MDPGLEPTPATAPPGRGVERRRRRRAAMAALAGAVIGALVGVVAVAIFDPRQTAYRWGIVIALAAIGLFAGGILAETPAAADVDVPVRDLDAKRHGRAATSEQGQLPGSPVKPAYDDADARRERPHRDL